MAFSLDDEGCTYVFNNCLVGDLRIEKLSRYHNSATMHVYRVCNRFTSHAWSGFLQYMEYDFRFWSNVVNSCKIGTRFVQKGVWGSAL